MAAELIAAGFASELTRITVQTVATFSSSAAQALMVHGIDAQVLTNLVAAASLLAPRTQYETLFELGVSRPDFSFKSTFVNAMLGPGASGRATYEILADSRPGQRLLILVSGLGCAGTGEQVIEVLRHLVSASARRPVAPLQPRLFQACTYPPLARAVHDEIRAQLEWYADAFVELDQQQSRQKGRSRMASRAPSALESAALLLAVARLQHDNPNNKFIRIRNAGTFEEIFAVLTVLYPVRIKVGDLAPHCLPLPGRGGKDAQQYVDIVFERDEAPDISITFTFVGSSLPTYIIPYAAVVNSRRYSNTKLARTVVQAKARLRMLGRPWRELAVTGLGWLESDCDVFERARKVLAARVSVEPLALSQLDRIALQVVENFIAFVKSAAAAPMASQPSSQSATPLPSRSPSPIPPTANLAANSPPASSQTNDDAQWLCDEEQKAPQRQRATAAPPYDFATLWYAAFLQAVFGEHALQLEIWLLERQRSFGNLLGMMGDLQEMITAYKTPWWDHRHRPAASTSGGTSGGIPHNPQWALASAVQCGCFVLLPRFLAEEDVGDDPTLSPFVMLSATLQMGGYPVDGIYHNAAILNADEEILPASCALPTDMDMSDSIEYVYSEYEWQARFDWGFYTIEGDETLDLNELLRGILTMRVLGDPLPVGTPAAKERWATVRPTYGYEAGSAIPNGAGTAQANSTPAPGQAQGSRRIVVAAYQNRVARRQAISRAATAGRDILLYTGDDYREGLAYAEKHDIRTVIL